MRAPVSDPVRDILESLNLIPYVIQYHYIAGNAWVIHSQFDTLEEAREALERLPLYGRCIYRIAEAVPHITYNPV